MLTKIIYKNFRSNFKNYVAFFIGNMMGVTEFFVFWGLYSIVKNMSANSVMLEDTLEEIIISVSVITIFSTALMVYSMLNYIKKRIADYSLFYILGMKKQKLYVFVFSEYLAGWMVSLLIGLGIGRGILYLIQQIWHKLFPTYISLCSVGTEIYFNTCKISFFIMLAVVFVLLIWADNSGMQKDEDTKIDLYNKKVQLFMDASGEESKYYYFSELEIDDENQDNLAAIEDVALNSDAYTVIEKPTPSDSYMILFWKVECIEERMYPDIIKIEENEFFYKKYVFYYTEKELQCFEKWCRSLKTNGKPMLDTVLEAVQFLNDESEQVQFLTRLLSKVPFFNPIFPKAVMNDFDEMVKQKIDGIRKQKQNVEMLNDMFIRSIEEASFNVEVLSDMIYQKLLGE